MITIGPEGVRVEPVVDPTKIALTFFPVFFGVMGKLLTTRARRR